MKTIAHQSPESQLIAALGLDEPVPGNVLTDRALLAEPLEAMAVARGWLHPVGPDHYILTLAGFKALCVVFPLMIANLYDERS